MPFANTPAIDNLSADNLQRQSALFVCFHCSVKRTDKVVPVLIKHRVTKAAGRGGTAPLTTKFGIIWRYVVRFTVRPRKPPRQPMNETGWAPVFVWTPWRRATPLAAA